MSGFTEDAGGSGARPAPRPAGWRLATAAASSVLGTAAVLAGLMALVNRPAWWRGLLAAAVVNTLAAAASVPLLAWGLRRGLMTAVAGYFLTAAARIVISIGGGLLAIYGGGYPPLPTLLLIVVFYLVLLAAETTVVARSIWSAAA